jgi:hypothetical protein
VHYSKKQKLLYVAAGGFGVEIYNIDATGYPSLVTILQDKDFGLDVKINIIDVNVNQEGKIFYYIIINRDVAFCTR